MKIKYKITVGILSILIVLGIVMNLSIASILKRDMESNIMNSLEEIMKSTRESIKYRLTIDTEIDKKKLLLQESEYLSNYILLNYESNIEIIGVNGEVYVSNIENQVDNIESLYLRAVDGEVVVNLKYTDNGLKGFITYLIFINKESLGVLHLEKSFDDIYKQYSNTITFIGLIVIIVFLFILTLSYLVASKVTYPISLLINGIKEVGKGNYNTVISYSGNDEMSIVSKEFNNMNNKIQIQIDTIKNEKEKVETLEKSRKQFFDNVTHEIKTPLTAIMGYAEIIKDNIVNDEEFKKKSIERIYEESERLNLLVLDLIKISKGISTVDENKIEIALDEVINQICDDMQIKASKYGIKINRNITPGKIYGRINKIRELFINIADNAIKYSSSSNIIYINTKVEERYYCIDIINYGEKIPDNIYNSIFDPFVKDNIYKYDESRGLGLYLCSEIIKDHNGEITISNGEEIIVNIKIPCFGNNLETIV
ncbi:HAMP domain-containing histidine kinase [Clostridium sp. NSJ-6]|uniref:histidine kinase n=1 Tax=Clostridium hominis TaxID=2763036 RepID=A0ABR7DHR5_9CLOT|nr:HAMP domain-containing sensor histidine kinase [Clostridium hominis]MBC5630985.1 HAMP domain-containing histidine kinase [Clostridium hominis]MDU2673683.1 HAMP domain-containing sensor histidine kinase [Clostridium sp.]